MKERLLCTAMFAAIVFIGDVTSCDAQPGIQKTAQLNAQVKVQIGYLLYLPKDYEKRESWPLLLFLHGSGERGDDLELVKRHGPPKLIAAGKEFPFIVVSPQCPKNRRWEPIELVALMDELSSKYKIDEDRVCVTGLSMGGYGTWRLASYAPDRLAAIAPVCGGGEKSWVKQFPRLPVWAFHGAKDTGVPPERSQLMIDELKTKGGNPKLTIYPEAGHDSWTETYDNPKLYEWLLEQNRTKQGPILKENITYGKGGETELKLDLAQPRGDGPFPAIVFIHGGGWYQGSRQGYRGQIMEAAKRGYVAATISYRLMKFDNEKKETTTAAPNFPAQIHDAKAAIRWLRANADKHHVAVDRIGVTGGSAGGHLSLLVGLTDAKSKLEGIGGNLDQSSRVQAVVNVFGPTDMAACHKTSSVAWIFRLFMGGIPGETNGTYKAASPITYASRDDPPVLTLHGDRDALVPIAQATKLDEKMKVAGASHTLMVFKGQGHGFQGESRQKSMNAMWDFFDRHLKTKRVKK